MFVQAIRSELYRLLRMKSTYILPVVLLGLVLLTNFIYMRIDLYGLLGFSQDDINRIQQMGTSAEGFEESLMTGFQAGLQSSESIQQGQSLHILGEGLLYHEDIATIFSLDVGLLHEILLLSIFIGLYIGSIYSTGLDKNLNIFAGRRGLLFAVRMLLIACYAFAIHIMTWITAFLSSAMMSEAVIFGFDRTFFMYFIITWILTVSFACIVFAMTHATRSKAAGITLGIILSAGMFSTLLSVASLIVQRRFNLGADFNLGNYTITHNLASISLFSDGHEVVRALVCALIYFIVSYTVSFFIVRKRDII